MGSWYKQSYVHTTEKCKLKPVKVKGIMHLLLSTLDLSTLASTAFVSFCTIPTVYSIHWVSCASTGNCTPVEQVRLCSVCTHLQTLHVT